MEEKVTIIGAGSGGLGTALQLARAGVEVQVLERPLYVGGLTSTLDLNGYRFDLRPTFFLYPRILREILAEVDLEIHRGATFNLAHTLGQMLSLLPQNIFQDCQGIHLVGGGTRAGSGLAEVA